MNWKHLFILMPLSLLLMGNEGCEEEQIARRAPEGRYLKKSVRLGHLSSSPINMPNGRQFDFEFVVNAQLNELLVTSDYFVVNENFIDQPIDVEDNESYERWESRDARKYDPEADSACLVHEPQIKVDGEIRSFE